MKRTFVIGDIHGELKALEQLLSRINPQDDDTFIFLGDYVDGWSESAQVIDYLIELSSIYHCVFIKGNHDVKCKSWLKNNYNIDNWVENAGSTTVKSYLKYSLKKKWEHADFLENTKLYHLDEKNRLFVHGGFASVHGVEYENHEGSYYWDRTLWEMVCAMDKTLKSDSPFYPSRLLNYEEIYIGHTPTIFLDETFDKPLNFANVWNIDTGAAFTGKLSAINIDTKEVFQSDVVQNLYPNEKGRNG